MISVFLIIFIAPTSAHVTYKDDSNNSLVVLHVTPDDDPIAGNETSLFFSLKDEHLSSDKNIYRLLITNSDNLTIEVSTYAIEKLSFGAKYIFPTPGRYKLKLVIEPVYIYATENSSNSTFEYELEVNRGVYTESKSKSKILWAYVVFIPITLISLFLGLTLYRNRKKILK